MPGQVTIDSRTRLPGENQPANFSRRLKREKQPHSLTRINLHADERA